MSDYKRDRWASMVEEAREDLAGTCPLVEDEAILWADARIAALESALKVCEEHTRGIFGAAHPVTIAIQQVKR